MSVGRHLITGAAGFIGSQLTDRLPADVHDVVGIDSFEDCFPRAFKEANLAHARSYHSFRPVGANLFDLERLPGSDGAGERFTELAELLGGNACVYHLAAQAGMRVSWGSSFEVYTGDNLLATQRLLEACIAVAAPRSSTVLARSSCPS